MVALLRPRRWMSQPQYPVGIDNSQPFARETIWIMTPNTNMTLHDSRASKDLSHPGGLTIDGQSRVATFNGSQQQNLAFTLPAVNPDGIVICARIKATATQAGNPGAAFGLYNSGAQFGYGVGFDTSNNVGGAWLSSANAGIVAYSAGAQNVWYTVYAEMIINGGQNQGSAWIDGVPATTNQATIFPGAANTFNEIAIGAQHRSSGFLRAFKGNIEWAAILSLPNVAGTLGMTDSLAAALYASGYPWSIFTPQVS